MNAKRMPSFLAASLLAVVVALSVGAFWVIHRGVDRQDQELLTERIGRVVLLLQRQIDHTGFYLSSVGGVEWHKATSRKVFFFNANAARTQPDETVLLVTKGRSSADGDTITPGPPQVHLVAGSGYRSGELLTGQLARIALTPPRDRTMTASPVINVAGRPSVVFSIIPPAIGIHGYVTLEVVPVFPGRATPAKGLYHNLDLAVYATPGPRQAELIGSTIGRRPLPGPIEVDVLKTDHVKWIVAGAAAASLLNPATYWAPWVVLGLGLVLAVGMAITVDTLARRQREQRTASETLQAALLGPVDQEFPDGVSARYEPAVRPLEVGGDWYDVIKLRAGRLGLIVGDCVGRGVEAAAVMGQLRSVSHSLMLQAKTPAEVLSDLDTFAQRVPAAHCTTVFCALLDPIAMTVVYSSAGHPPAIVTSRDGASDLLDRASSVPLAVGGADRREATAALTPGCTLALYTDGLIERRGESLDDGLTRLRHVIEHHRQLGVQSLATVVIDEMQAARSEDDVALLLYRQPLVEPPRLVVTMPADPAKLSDLRKELRAWLQDAGYAEESDGVLLSVGEACSNAIEHAYGFDPRSVIDIRAEIEGGRLTVTVADSGRWRRPDPNGVQRGRGLTLIQAFMDDYKIENGTGTTVHLRKDLSRER
jgi:anti-sigma regulatory factor (Ser/Thr protein kinase)